MLKDKIGIFLPEERLEENPIVIKCFCMYFPCDAKHCLVRKGYCL